MKLSSILQTIKMASPILEEFKPENVTLNGVVYKRLRNTDKLKKAFQQLKTLEIFDDYITPLEETVLYGINGNKLDVSSSEFGNIENALNDLSSAVFGLEHVLENLVPGVPENTV